MKKYFVKFGEESYSEAISQYGNIEHDGFDTLEELYKHTKAFLESIESDPNTEFEVFSVELVTNIDKRSFREL